MKSASFVRASVLFSSSASLWLWMATLPHCKGFHVNNYCGQTIKEFIYSLSHKKATCCLNLIVCNYSPLQLEPTFWGFPYKMAQGAKVENHLKVMLNLPIFFSNACINMWGLSMSFGSKIFNGFWVTSLQIWKYVPKKSVVVRKNKFQKFDSSNLQNHWKFCNQNSWRSFPQ